MSDEPVPHRVPPGDDPILQVRDLRTYFFTTEGVARAVDGVSFHVRAGEALGIVGESGSGKSVTALSIMRLLDESSRVVGGEIRFRGKNVLALSKDELRAIRGDGFAMVFQDPMTSLNPVLRVAKQLTETMRAHGRYTGVQALTRAISLLQRMGITAPERAVKGFPHQFSGGMRQRVMLAMGFSNDPALLIADEPTTALDVTIQAQILDLLRKLNADSDTAIILISHDLGVIANVCARVAVMYAGEVVEEGPTEALLADPKHPYTWALLNAVPRLKGNQAGSRRLITIEGTPPDPFNWPTGCRFLDRCPFRIDQCTSHPDLVSVGPARAARCWVTQAGGKLPAVGGAMPSPNEGGSAPASLTPPARLITNADSSKLIDLTKAANADARSAASAKATTALPSATDVPTSMPSGGVRAILQLRGLTKHFPAGRAGTWFGKPRVVHAVDGVDFDVFPGETVGLVGESGCGKSTIARLATRILEPTAGTITFEGRDIAHDSGSQLRPLRRRMQMIFQDPYASLNPRMRVRDIISEPLRFHGLVADARSADARVNELLALVGLPERVGSKFPHEFSGGQRQRISIARALALSPQMIVADEPISSLDVNIQAQIINLLVDLQERMGLTYLFIAHDLAVVRHISDRVVVLYLGKVMEVASSANLFSQPLHPYTRALIASVPVPDVAFERARPHVPLGGEPPSAIDPPSGCRFRTRCPMARPRCAEETPALVEHRPGQWAACHYAGE